MPAETAVSKPEIHFGLGRSHPWNACGLENEEKTLVATSSEQAEYIAMSDCVKQLSWIRKLFWEMANKQG